MSRTNTGAIKDFCKALKWTRMMLSECARLKHDCQSKSGVLPKRVLDLGEPTPDAVGADASDVDLLNKDVRLYETTGNCGGVYMTLSHCRGKAKLIRTLTENINDHKNGISFA